LTNLVKDGRREKSISKKLCVVLMAGQNNCFDRANKIALSNHRAKIEGARFFSMVLDFVERFGSNMINWVTRKND